MVPALSNCVCFVAEREREREGEGEGEGGTWSGRKTNQIGLGQREKIKLSQVLIIIRCDFVACRIRSKKAESSPWFVIWFISLLNFHFVIVTLGLFCRILGHQLSQFCDKWWVPVLSYVDKGQI
jgi:hypothetical protein